MSECTVVTRATGERCGSPAVATFTTSRGEVFAECAEHAVVVSTPEPEVVVEHPPTRTTAPFVLVKSGKIVGYAHSRSVAVVKRAERLSARIVEVVR